VSIRIEHEQRNRVVARAIDVFTAIAGNPSTLLHVEIGRIHGLDTLLQSKPTSAFANEHHVLRLLHDTPRGRDRMHDAFDPRQHCRRDARAHP
jgi:hypothetical protein